jgi:hypothetical protein
MGSAEIDLQDHRGESSCGHPGTQHLANRGRS